MPTPRAESTPTPRRKDTRWKVGDRNFNVEIKRIFRQVITKRNGQKDVATKADIKCDCGTEKTIYLANFVRTKSCSTNAA